MTKMRNRWVGKHSCEAGAQGAERSKKKPSKLRGEGGGRGRTERGYHTFWLIRRSNGKPSKSLSQQAICSELYFGMVSLAAAWRRDWRRPRWGAGETHEVFTIVWSRDDGSQVEGGSGNGTILSSRTK